MGGRLSGMTMSLDCFALPLKAGVSPMRSPQPRTAIVTGAGKRVGAALAAHLAGTGWDVIAHVHHAKDPVPERATRVVADLTEPDGADLVFDVAENGSPVCLLVNNAARFAWDGFGEFSGNEFDSHMAVNARAPALLIDRFAKQCEADRDALVVNILDAKLFGPNPDYLSYTLSKQALAGLTDLAARALAPRGIRVNAIAPGLMLQSAGQSADNYAAMHAGNPLGRGVEPADIAGCIDYLVSARCVTGQTIVIDSGHRFLSLERDVQFLGDL
jgi:NAD(P)-dependent dehydrogenase (short-subunit alcohol dehydrogenase family)